MNEELEGQNLYLKEELDRAWNFQEIVGASPAMQNVFQSVEMVAGTDATVLLLGETGTGKELIAHAVHDRSARQSRQMVKVNCAALPEHLIESELFGHEKGAFTSAVNQKKGRFELADGGTIFLDEIGEMPLEAQTKLLRILQEKEFERIGGNRTMKVNVRVIAATNRDLDRHVALAALCSRNLLVLYRRELICGVRIRGMNLRGGIVPSLHHRKEGAVARLKFIPPTLLMRKQLGL